ncbi:Arc family DNA-binding protein [Devosia sp. BSSL-BM10]|uniref:Arc family DNA-binding protein n=1 Tax=Devosia litorisediminis TaxID=2829817 RepID=A0A942E7Y1_9HYPH|nr:Arc family DNA-binding protein [Devosia litorisediminis]MBS3849710.1 Arc family DNA-binding protein [Devosia litorisediminis]
MALKPKQTHQYPLRLPPGMSERIRQQAASNRRSMNSEIIHYLDWALKAQEAKGPASVEALPSHGHDQTPARIEANELERE